MTTGPAIVAVGYNRPASLERLLTSLKRIEMPQDGAPDQPSIVAPLIISLDGGLPEVVEVAERFEWPHGPKIIRTFRPNLKLRRHILACGDLALEYPGAVVLEDDLYVSSDMYRYACSALEMYGEHPQVGGISLYSYRFAENRQYAFHPLQDGYDTFFLQMPSSWGQVWSRSQWSAFTDWYERESSAGVKPEHGVPRSICLWSEQSWKKYFARFLIETGRTFAYPRTGLTTNCGDPGEHCHEMDTDLMTPLSFGRKSWSFAPPETGMHHDTWFEPTADSLSARFGVELPSDVAIDFHGFKGPEEIRGSHILSVRDNERPISTYPLTLLPLAANLQLRGAGNHFSLGPLASAGLVSRAKRRDLYRLLNGQVGIRLAGELFTDRLALRLRQRWENFRAGK